MRLLHEPTLQFFLLGALIFAAHRLVAGDPRTITVAPVLRDDLARRFRDQTGRWPSPVELEEAARKWKADEALYREALRDHLDREDLMVRTMLADKVRARAALEVRERDPSNAELEQWLTAHRNLYETPLHYECDYLAFPKNATDGTVAVAERDRVRRALSHGAAPTGLGRPVFQPNLTREQLAEKFGPQLAARIVTLALGSWHQLETDTEWLLVRVNRVEGGLPDQNRLRERLAFDWQMEMKRLAVEQAVDRIVGRYRFVERPR